MWGEFSDGNSVNVGNFDSDGLNVNNDSRDNANSNLGVCPSRQYRRFLTIRPSLREGLIVKTDLRG